MCPIELADEYFRRMNSTPRVTGLGSDEMLEAERRHEASKRQLTENGGDWHPSYREYWVEHQISDCQFTHACAGMGILPARGTITEPQIAGYLDSLNATLWGRAWDLSQEGGRDGAKRWLIGVLTALGVEVVK